MKSKYHLFFIFVLILIIPNVGSVPNLSGMDKSDKIGSHNKLNPSQIVSELDENTSIPFISTDESKIELGDDIIFFFGMRDGITFIEDYNYSIYLAEGSVFLNNDTSKLSNYTLIVEGITKWSKRFSIDESLNGKNMNVWGDKPIKESFIKLRIFNKTERLRSKYDLFDEKDNPYPQIGRAHV